MINNADKLDKKLKEIIEAATGESIVRASSNAIRIVQTEAKLLCPTNHGELRQSIKTDTEETEYGAQSICYTNKEHALYVEFGTGPIGQKNHFGISPEASVSYSQNGWFIPADKMDKADAEKYKFYKYTHHLDGYLAYEKDFYFTMGQAAQPFMYPALKNHEDRVTKNINNYVKRKVKEAIQNND